MTVVLDKSTKTRSIIEKSGLFALQVPTLKQLKMVYALGMISQYDAPEKLRQCGVELFQFGHSPIPVVEGCSAWILCELIPEPHNQQQHDLFIGKVIGTTMKPQMNGKVSIMLQAGIFIPLVMPWILMYLKILIKLTAP